MLSYETLSRLEKALNTIRQELPPHVGPDGTTYDDHRTLAAENGAVRYCRGVLTLQDARDTLHQAEADFYKTQKGAHKRVTYAWFQRYGAIVAAEFAEDPDLTEEDRDIRAIYLR